MNNRLLRYLVPAVLGCFSLGCEPSPEAGISPDTAAPGETVRVVLATASPSEGAQTSVQIGGQAATITRVISATELEVLVPQVSAGAASVVAREGGQAVGTGSLTVLSPTSKSLILSLEDNQVTLVSTVGAGGGWWETVDEGGRRLSYDVLSAQGGLVFTGATSHPTLGRIEVFEDPGPGDVHGAPVPRSATFAIKIPNIPGATTVKIYDVDAGVDLSTAEGRAARRLLTEIAVND